MNLYIWICLENNHKQSYFPHSACSPLEPIVTSLPTNPILSSQHTSLYSVTINTQPSLKAKHAEFVEGNYYLIFLQNTLYILSSQCHFNYFVTT